MRDLLPVVAFLLSFLALLLLRYTLLKYLTNRSENAVYNLMLKTIRFPSLFLVFAIPLYVSLQFLRHTQKEYIVHVEKIVLASFILSVSIFLANLAVEALKLYAGRAGLKLPSANVVFALIKGFIVLLGVISVLNLFGIPVVHLVTTLGVGALAVSLALQSTLSNFFSGLSIISSRQIEIGDFVRLENGEEGYVIDITWMNTVIKRADNNLVIVPSSRMVNMIVINYRKPIESMNITIPVNVSYNSDLDKVERITFGVAKEVQKSVEGADPNFEPVVRFTEFGENSIKLNVTLRVLNSDYQGIVRHEFIRRLKQAYDAEGVRMNFLTVSTTCLGIT
ncbi:mechanosensitive ion channel family protein [Thermocrinis minervae]|uniref:Small-conductance mechanosensitive channel n=1 Tax=Thermocrinis minervae TaxID=381751 RepID=A0A1M6TIX6_9AQUI|nr:mechanosensitive ion channel family protein [Thermocrinis minervae]SHK56921.1 Small-conductance mechanosensitive channel [Thermocrinis minervae]